MAVLLSGAVAAPVWAQGPAAQEPALTGTVRDVSGAVMQAVPIAVRDAGGETVVATGVTNAEGAFAIPLPPGDYRLLIALPAFARVDSAVTVTPGAPPLAIVLDLAIEVAVDVTPTDELLANTMTSLTATTLAGDELLDLPTNEEDLARYLMLLAGADFTGDLEEDILANFVVDGFDDDRLPRPDQISQIIVDPSPMTANGNGRPRIEIITRPGIGEWQRSVDFGFADESLNARTPGETRKEPRQTRTATVEAEGPLVPGVLELTVEASTRTDEQAGPSLRAVTPDRELFSGVVQPEEEREVEVGLEFQVTPAHRFDVLVSRGTERSTNEGVGGFTLPERGSSGEGSNWTFRVSERMFGERTNNNVRLQVRRTRSLDVPVRSGFAIDVADAFEGGGGTNRGEDDALSVSLENTLRLERGAWNLEMGGELGYERRQSIDRDNYNGTFEFASLHDYCLATGLAGGQCVDTAGLVAEAAAAGLTPVAIDGRGRAVEITGIPTTFTQAFGNAAIEIRETAFSAYVQADRRFGEQASLRLGLRYAATSHSRDFLRIEPTVLAQYRLTPTTLLGLGARVGFDDFRDYERLLRNDGSSYETELSISAPSFPDPFRGGTVEVGAETASLWVLDPAYQAPYTITPSLSVTQELPGRLRVSLSYNPRLGIHEGRTRNINAPLPGTPLPDEILDLPRDERQDVIDRLRPMYPFVGNVTQIESTGRSVTHTVRLQAQPRGRVEVLGVGLSGNVNYTYRTGHDDNDFDNPWVRTWGPSDRLHTVQSRFQVRLPGGSSLDSPVWRALAAATWKDLSLNFDFRASAGRLYSIRSGRDLNGDQSSRDRLPGAGRNTAVGPANWNLDMTLTKDIPLAGGEGASEGGRGRFDRSRGPRLRFQARVDNVLNHSQPRAYGSVVTSPLFGQPTGYTGGRTVALSTSVDF
jgi:hypothetical protein